MHQPTLFDLADRPAPPREPMPPHVAAETSREAAESVRDHVSRLRVLVVETIRSAGARGMTTDEVEIATGLAHQTASPRVGEAFRRGLIVEAKDGEGNTVKRPTRSGRRAIVYLAAEAK